MSSTVQTATVGEINVKTKKKRPVPRWLLPRNWAPPAVAFLIVTGLWEIIAAWNPYLLPRLPAVLGSLASKPEMYFSNFLVTLQEVAVGAGAGILGGFILAVIMCRSEERRVRKEGRSWWSVGSRS